MASTRQGGLGIGLPINYPVPNPNQSTLTPSAVTVGVGPVTLAAGEVSLIPAGQWMVSLGGYTFVQVKDPVLGNWRTVETWPGVSYVSSDGANYRLANLTGCAVGAVITNVGSGYTSAPTVTASAGGSTWTAIVGGAVSGTVTITNGGTLYDFPPQILIAPPPVGGVQASAVATLTSGVITAVTVTNQGAGYTAAPAITVLRDPRDARGSGAILASALTGSGTVTAIVRDAHGTPLTSVPTLSITGGGGASAAATVVMCFTSTGLTVGAGGAAYGNAQPFLVQTGGGVVTATPGATVNPSIGAGMFIPRQARFLGTSTAGGAVTATGLVTSDGGLFQSVPLGFVTAGGTALATTVAQVTMTVGGVTDTSLLFAA